MMAETGEPARRHCATCDSPVYDLRKRSVAEVVALLQAGGGHLCGQVYAREDGRVAFGPCISAQHLMRGGLTLS